MSETLVEYNVDGVEKHMEWDFHFTVSRRDGKELSENQINLFWDKLIEMAEANGVDIGGGYKPSVLNSATE